MSSTRIGLPFLLIAVFLVAVACGTDSSSTPTSGASSSAGSQVNLTKMEIARAAANEDLEAYSSNREGRTENGIRVEVFGPKVVQVGFAGTFFISISNQTDELESTDPFDIIQNEGNILLGGPIELESLSQPGIQGRLELSPTGLNEATHAKIRCLEVGTGVLSFQSQGEPAPTSSAPITQYAITVDNTFQCVEEDGDPETSTSLSVLTEAALGFPPASLNWVEFEENDIIVRVNQIEPIEMAVGQSAEIYGQYDAGDQPLLTRLIDAHIEFTHGDHVSISSPPERISDPFVYSFSDDPRGGAILVWGFRSGTLTCLEKGESVYTAHVRGVLAVDGGKQVDQNVSGLVDCVADPETVSGSGTSDTDDQSGNTGQVGGGEITDVSSPTAVVLDSRWSGLTANRNATGDTYNLGTKEDEIPYWDNQFRIHKPHAGCDIEHIHADHTVYAFENWSRGSSGWHTNAELAMDDPDPDGCGFGSEDELNGKPVAIDGQVFIELCIKLVERDGVSNLLRNCSSKINGVTQ